MANKYFDNGRVRIKKREYKELVDKGFNYSIRRKFIIGDVKLTVNWVGEFATCVPDEYCNTHEVHIENFVHGIWLPEPIDRLHHFASESAADWEFTRLVNALKKKHGEEEVETVSAYKTEIVIPKSDLDFSDFGEAPVSKNIPKTKSKNSGAW